MRNNNQYNNQVTPAPFPRQLIREHGFALADYYKREYKSSSHVPPQWVLDKIADEKITGKYNTKRTNLCGTCNTYKSVSGTCLCD